MKAYFLTQDQGAMSAKRVAKKARIVDGSKFVLELCKSSTESVWLTFEPSIIEEALKEPEIFEMRSSLKKKAYMLIFADAKKSWESTLDSLFKKTFIFSEQTSLSISEILEVFSSKNPGHLAIGGSINLDLKLLVLTRGDLSTIAIPLSAFHKSGDGIEPDFKKFSVVDGGQTLKFGEYEASVDSVLYEFDAEYRRDLKAQRALSDRSFGACLRRLRVQRGLLQTDFGDVDEKVIGRIERGEVERPRNSTINKIAKVLGVPPDDILSY